MRMPTRDDVKALTADQKLELMELLSESLEEEHIPVSPAVRDEVEFPLTRRQKAAVVRTETSRVIEIP